MIVPADFSVAIKVLFIDHIFFFACIFSFYFFTFYNYLSKIKMSVVKTILPRQ